MAGDRDLLLGMGFEAARVDWALRATKNSGLQPALDFLFAHTDDPIPDSSAQAIASGTSTSSGNPANAAEDVDDEDDDTIGVSISQDKLFEVDVRTMRVSNFVFSCFNEMTLCLS